MENETLNLRKADHSLSLQMKARVKDETNSIILDTGYTNVAVPYNLKYLGLTLENIEAIIFNHDHNVFTNNFSNVS